MHNIHIYTHIYTHILYNRLIPLTSVCPAAMHGANSARTSRGRGATVFGVASMAVPGFWVGLFQGPEVERKDIKRGLLNVFYVFFVNLLLKFYKKPPSTEQKRSFSCYGSETRCQRLISAMTWKSLLPTCKELYMTSQFQEDV